MQGLEKQPTRETHHASRVEAPRAGQRPEGANLHICHTPPYRPAHRQSALTSSFEAPEILPEYRLVASLRSNERSASAMSLWASAWTWNL